MTPATKTTAQTHEMSFDTKGFDYVELFVGMVTVDTTKANLGTLKLSESDTVTSPSSMTDISTFTGGSAITAGTADFVIPGMGEMGDGAGVVMNVDLRGRKRYLGLSITSGDETARNTYALARLSKAEESRENGHYNVAGVTTGDNDARAKNFVHTANTAVALVING
jgi:hypothetical protein